MTKKTNAQRIKELEEQLAHFAEQLENRATHGRQSALKPRVVPDGGPRTSHHGTRSALRNPPKHPAEVISPDTAASFTKATQAIEATHGKKSALKKNNDPPPAYHYNKAAGRYCLPYDATDEYFPPHIQPDSETSFAELPATART